MNGELGAPLRRDREPPRDPQRAADPARRRAALLHGAGARAHPRRARRGRPRGRRRPLLRDGFLYEMLIAHEHQHNETMLQLLQMVERYEPAEVDAARSGRGRPTGPEMVAGRRRRARDRRRRRRASPTTTSARATRSSWTPSRSTATPVTNGAFAEFVADTGAEPPRYWERDGEGGWVRTAMGTTRRSIPSLPVVHVDWHAGRRLRALGRQAAADRVRVGGGRGRAPTATTPTSTTSRSAARPPAPRREPRAAGRCRCSATSGSGPRRTSPATRASRAFPYPEYSEVFFGPEHKVLRGGSWATRRDVIRTSFRNWDLPERSQIFSGLRCVRDGR